MESEVTRFGRGVLNQAAQARVSMRSLHEPSPDIGRFVELYWMVRWEVPEGQTYESKVLSHPNIHLVFELPEPTVYGVVRSDMFRRHLEGSGHVLGIKFRPGGFRPFFDAPVSALADGTLPAAQIFGAEADVEAVGRKILETNDLTAMVGIAEEFLRPHLPADTDPTIDDVAEIVRRIMSDQTLTRVEQVASEFGTSVRHLQRLFSLYVGVGPKWVLRRARLHEAAVRMDQGREIDWAALASELGYADQAHLTRDFTATVGTSPGAYARRQSDEADVSPSTPPPSDRP